eukprot:gene11448-14567_t
MNEWVWLVLFLLLGYLLGSIPSAVWIGKIFFKKDVRQFGSGNAGATNTFRVLGKTAGTVVLAMDILKGFFAVQLPHWAGVGFHTPGGMDDFAMLCGIAAVLGHLYPVFAGFKGGKGVATALGIVLAASPWASLSAGSIIKIAAVLLPLLIIYTHRTNIGKLLKGTE